uniref:Uncharacterized protein n=1 Tax=Anguilla anguilla TaxID=7936 RepID=A0A0E9VNA3_ANGAN
MCVCDCAFQSLPD